MESPVRIKSIVALTIFVLWLSISITNGFPANSVSDESSISDHDALLKASKIGKSNESLFAPRNTTTKLKRYPSQTRYTTAPSVETPSSIKVFESTTNVPNIANRINFRGSVKYFVTRPTYRPKVANPRRNVTRYRHAASEKVKTVAPINKTENLVIQEPVIKSTEVKKSESISSENQKKSTDLEFSIDKYTSPEFHDINNVYSQSVSPEIQQFIVPGNVSNYYVNMGSSPYTPSSANDSDEDEEDDDFYSSEMTTPKTGFFDTKYKELSNKIKQNLEVDNYEPESKFSKEDDKITTERIEDLLSLGFRDLLTRPPSDQTKISYKNTKQIILTDSKDSSNNHRDVVDSNGEQIFYESSILSTQDYEQKSSTMKIIPDSSEENELSTTRPQEKIVSPNSRQNEITKRLDRSRFNNNINATKETRTTIRMRPHTTPRPRMRISLIKTSSSTESSSESVTTTRTPDVVKMSPFLRRAPWLSTISSKIDPVYQESSGPPKIVGRTKSDSENTIPGLRKRGSSKYPETNSTSDTQLSFPPTATAWALITLKDTPLAKRNNTKELESSTTVETEIPTEMTTTKVSEIQEDNTLIPQKKFSVYESSPTKKITTNSLNTILGINNSGGFKTEIPETDDREEDSLGSNTSFESITKVPIAVTTPAYETESSTSDSDYFGITGEDSETERFDVDPEDSTTTEIPTTRRTSIETTSEMLMDLTTLISKPYAQQRTTFTFPRLRTTTTSIPTTTETLEETTIFKRFRTTTPPPQIITSAKTTTVLPQELPSIKTTSTTTTDYKFRVSSDWQVAHRNQVVTTTTESMNSTKKGKGKGDDALEDFSFESTTGSLIDTTTLTVKNTSEDIETASTTFYTPQRSTTTYSINTTPPTVKTEAPTIAAEDHDLDSSEDEDEERPTDKIEEENARSTTVKDESETTTSSSFTTPSNIEIIKPESKVTHPESNESSVDDDDKFEEMMGGSSGAIAAIAIAAVGIVALLLLIGLLIVARGRRRSGGYGQRCTPVSLDSYSLDNVSVGGSTRKARRSSKRSYGNPAYDESGATSHPMQFAALANFALDQDSIVSEFNEIPSVTVRADEIPPGCEAKNRYSNVIPIPETRVTLSAVNGEETSEYINANFVRGPKNMKNYYIASQAPMSSTVNDFWRMVWEQNSKVVLMLTELMENGAEKCFEYIPPSEASDNRRVFGDYQITMLEREVRDKYVISHLQLKNLVTKTHRDITHMWYFWPAKGVPDEHHSIIAYLIEARSCLKAAQSSKEYDEDGKEVAVDESNPENVYNIQTGEKTSKNGTLKDSKKRAGPMVVHCSPGTGRTGTVIACDIGIRDFEISRTVDVPKTVYKIRRDRANTVQTKDQYIFIYKVLSEYAAKLTGGVLNAI